MGDKKNTVENLWAIIKKRLKGKDFTKKENSIEYLFDIWRNLPPEIYQKLVTSIYNRITQVLRSSTGYSDL